MLTGGFLKGLGGAFDSLHPARNMRKHVIDMNKIRIGNETGETMDTSWKID